MTIFFRLNLPAICSGDQYNFNFSRIYFFKYKSFSIFLFRWVFLSFASLEDLDDRYFPSVLPLLISRQILVGFLFKIRLISCLLVLVRNRAASLTLSSLVKCVYVI